MLVALVLPLFVAEFSQGHVSITFSQNPVYEKENVTLMCNYGTTYGLLSVTVEVFNDTHKQGSLYCHVQTADTTGTGVFVRSSFIGCPLYSSQAGTVSVSMQASQALEQDYTCAVRVHDDTRFYRLTSNATRLTVNAMPEPPSLNPSPLVFKDVNGTVITIVCESRFGDPASQLYLSVARRDGPPMQNRGSESVSVTLPYPLSSWHKAAVMCTVENHNYLPNTTIQDLIHVDYIYSLVDKFIDVDTTWKSETLDCSENIKSTSSVTYRWTVPVDVKVLDVNSSSIVVPEGATGVFSCNAFHIVTMKSVRIAYNATGTILKDLTLGLTISATVLVATATLMVGLHFYYKKKRSSRNSGVMQPVQLMRRIDVDRSCKEGVAMRRYMAE